MAGNVVAERGRRAAAEERHTVAGKDCRAAGAGYYTVAAHRAAAALRSRAITRKQIGREQKK